VARAVVLSVRVISIQKIWENTRQHGWTKLPFNTRHKSWSVTRHCVNWRSRRTPGWLSGKRTPSKDLLRALNGSFVQPCCRVLPYTFWMPTTRTVPPPWPHLVANDPHSTTALASSRYKRDKINKTRCGTPARILPCSFLAHDVLLISAAQVWSRSLSFRGLVCDLLLRGLSPRRMRIARRTSRSQSWRAWRTPAVWCLTCFS